MCGQPNTSAEWFAAAKRAAKSAQELAHTAHLLTCVHPHGPPPVVDVDYKALSLYYRHLALHFFSRALMDGDHPERLRSLRSLA